MKDKKKTIVMFGDSLTDYFPMDKLKDIDADIINSGVAGDTIAETLYNCDLSDIGREWWH